MSAFVQNTLICLYNTTNTVPHLPCLSSCAISSSSSSASSFITHPLSLSKTSSSLVIRFVTPAAANKIKMDVEVEQAVRDDSAVVDDKKTVPVWDRRDPVKNPVVEIMDTEEYLQMLATSKGKVIVLKFYAPWCRSCKAVEPKYRRLAREYDNILFAEINFEAQKALCYRLGVKSLPHFHFYQNEAGKVEDFQAGPTKFDNAVRAKVREYSGEVCVVKQDNNYAQN